MALGSSGGTNLGSAYGKIHIDTTAMLLARKIVRDSAREMAEETRRFGQSWDTTSQTMRTSLRGISSDLKQTSSDLTGLSVAAGAVALGGLKAAMSVKTIEASYRVMLGSQRKANEELATLRTMADAANQPFLELAETGRMMLATSKANNVEISKLVALSQQLQVVDPTARGFDVSIALREFLAGSELSLVRRFEGLDKGALKEIIDTTSTAQERIQALEQYLNQLGFSRDLLIELGQEGLNAFSVLTSEIQETLAVGFGPFLNDVLIPASQQFGAFLRTLRETDPALLKIGAGFTLAAAAIAPLTFAASQLLSTLSTLNRLGVVKVGVLVTAAVVGAEIGAGISRVLADRGVGDQRLRSDSGEDPNAVLWERAKQLGVIIFTAMSDVAAVLHVGGQLFGDAINYVVLQLKDAGLGVVETISRFVADLASKLNATDIAKSFTDIALNANRQRFGYTDNSGFLLGTDQASSFVPGTQQQLDTAGKRIDQYIGGDAWESGNIWSDTIQGMRERFVKPFNDFLFPAIKESGEQTGDAIEQTGSVFLKALTSLITAQAEAAQKIGELNDEYERETQRLTETRDIAAARERFDNDLQRGRNLADFQRSQSLKEADWLDARAKRIAAFAAETGNLELQALARRTETLANYQRDEARRAEDHGRRLQEIQENTQVNVLKAAAKLDAVGVFNALQSGTMEAQRENTTFSVESTRRKEDLDLQLQQLDIALRQQQDERARAFAQQLAEEAMQHEQQRVREEAEFALRIERENEDRALRLQRQQEDQQRDDALRKADQQRKIQDLIKHLANELTAYQAMLTNASAAFGQARQMFINFVNDARSAMASLGSGSGVTYAPGAGANMSSATTNANPLAPLANAATSFMKLLGFEEGVRRVPFDMPAYLHEDELIHPANQNPYAGGVGNGLMRPSVVIENFAPVIGDIGDRSDADVIALLDTAVRQLFAQAAARQAGG